MAQQTNSWIKERRGGKLQERNSSYFYHKNKKAGGRLKEENEALQPVDLFLSSHSFLFFSLPSFCFCSLIAISYSTFPLFTTLAFYLSQRLDECQAKLSYPKTCWRVSFAEMQGSVLLEQSRRRITWLRIVMKAALCFFSSSLLHLHCHSVLSSVLLPLEFGLTHRKYFWLFFFFLQIFMENVIVFLHFP